MCVNYEQDVSKPSVNITVRLPEEYIEWTDLNEFDLLMCIRKLLPKNNTNDGIEYNTIHQYLTYIFPNQCHCVARELNNQIFAEEYYIQPKGEIGTKDCKIKIKCDRPLIAKEIGKILPLEKDKYKATTCDSREIDAEYDSVEEVRQKLLDQLDFNPHLNWHSKLYKAFDNFMNTPQIFRPLEAEIDCSEFSSLNDLYLLPTMVIKQFKMNDVTFGDFNKFYDTNNPILKPVEGLTSEKALQRKDKIHYYHYQLGHERKRNIKITI